MLVKKLVKRRDLPVGLYWRLAAMFDLGRDATPPPMRLGDDP